MTRKYVSCFIMAVCLAWPMCARDTELPASLPVEQWLNGPDRQDIAWKVQIFQKLTLQQRDLVQVLASIRGRDYLEGVSARDFYFVTRLPMSAAIG